MVKATANGIPVHRHPAVWFSRIKTKWPILIWVGAVACAWWLYQQRGPPTAFVGLLHVQHETAAPLDAGRVLEIAVRLGDRVEAGQVLARIQPQAVEADPTLNFDVLRIQRQFVQFVQSAENALREVEIDRARDEAELGALSAELERLEALRERGLVDDEVIARVRVPQMALQKAVSLYPEYIVQLTRQLDEARQQQDATLGQIATMEMPEAGQTMVVELRALQAGTVSNVPASPGSVVNGGDPVVVMLTDGPQSVLGYVHEAQTFELTTGQTVYLQTASGDGTWLPGTIEAVSPDIAPLPVQFQRMPDGTVRGRRVIIQPGDGFSAAPGERISIALAPQSKWF